MDKVNHEILEAWLHILKHSTETNEQARQLFAPIASDYDTWSRVLSFWQDPRWRREMVDRLGLAPGATVLDVAAGTGLVSSLHRERGCRAVALDQSREMLAGAAAKGFPAVIGRAEQLPFAEAMFDGLTFTYLLRYVDDALGCLRELVRVVKPGGRVGMVEFGRPRGPAGPLWWVYTRLGLPMAGGLISPGWRRVGRFLGQSIDRFHDRYPEQDLKRLWREAGLRDVGLRRLSLQGGLVMWGQKP